MALSIDQNRYRKPRRTLLYGPGGIGKSSWGATLDQATKRPIEAGIVFLPCEEGINDLPDEIQRFPLITHWDQLMGYIGEIAQEPHEFRKVVLDTADWAEKLSWARVCLEKGVEAIGDVKYGKGYIASVRLWQELLMSFDWLRDNRGMDIVILAHAKAHKFEDPENPSYDRWQPKLHEHVDNLIFEWADEVFFANFQTIVKTEDAGFNREIGKAKGTGKRIMRTTARPAAKAKNRLSMPDEIPFDYSEYLKYRNK